MKNKKAPNITSGAKKEAQKYEEIGIKKRKIIAFFEKKSAAYHVPNAGEKTGI